MSTQGILLIDFFALILIGLLLNLVRTKKLFPSYAVIWISAVVGMMLLVSIPSFLTALPKLVGAVYPASALSLLAFIFIFVVLIFMSVKFSMLSARQIQMIQAFAIRSLDDDKGDTREPEEE